jgi:hypothetical protein
MCSLHIISLIIVVYQSWCRKCISALKCACSIDPAIVGSTGGRLLLESSGVRPSHSIWCPPWLRNASPWGPFSEPPKVTRFSQRSSWVMSHGCSPKTRRRRYSQQSGAQRRLPDQRYHALSNPRKKWCSLHFLTSTVGCFMSSHHLDRPLTFKNRASYIQGVPGGKDLTSG